jgi:undecaprenyl diphosphate synthase
MFNQIVRFWRRKDTEGCAEADVNKLIKKIDKNKLPGHIAIIMDGNGRWALRRGLTRSFGHRVGVESLRDIVRLCSDLGIGILTLYAFSTENWKRPQEEINILMDLLVEYFYKEIDELCQNGVRVHPIGRLAELPASARKAIDMAVQRTRENKGLTMNLALNYGGRNEIVDAVRAIAAKIANDRLSIEQIGEKVISDHLYTAGQPDPDLLIRPSGDLRISNFLLWQLAYTEFWFSSVMWPDFRRIHILQALVDYQQRERRFGGLNKGTNNLTGR